MLELKVQNTVLLTAFGGRSRGINKEVFIPFVIGGDCFENVFCFWSAGRIVVN